MRLAFAFIAVIGGTSALAAETVAVEVLEASGLDEGEVARARKACEVALRQLSSFTVKGFAAGAPRRSCGGEVGCLLEVARGLGADHALLVSLRASGGRLLVDGYLTGDGRATHRRVEGVPSGSPEEAMKPLVEALLPSYACAGHGGLKVEAEPLSLVKVNGEVLAQTPMEPIALSAGVHLVEVKFPSGQLVMKELRVRQGERLRVEVRPPPIAKQEPSGREVRRLRMVSYGLLGAGGLAVAGSLWANAASRGAAAAGQYQPAVSYGLTANILLGAGVALAASGAVVLILDIGR